MNYRRPVTWLPAGLALPEPDVVDTGWESHIQMVCETDRASLANLWWDALDNVTRTALTALGYTPDALTDGVTALDDGEPGFILAFLEDLETVA